MNLIVDIILATGRIISIQNQNNDLVVDSPESWRKSHIKGILCKGRKEDQMYFQIRGLQDDSTLGVLGRKEG